MNDNETVLQEKAEVVRVSLGDLSELTLGGLRDDGEDKRYEVA